MNASRWIRLDTTWSKSDWVASLDAEARLAWVELLCHTKANGDAGSVKRLAPSVAARSWGLRVTAVTEMEVAAVADGALVVDGDEWIICGWAERQSDPKAAERLHRYRERQQLLTEESPEGDVTRDSGNVTDNAPSETKTKKKHSVDKPADPFPVVEKLPMEGGNYVYPGPFARAWAVYPSREGSNPKVGAYRAFRARVKRGVDPEQLVKAAEHYRTDCEQRQAEGTAFVLEAAMFWGGKKEPWRDFIDPPELDAQRHDPHSIPEDYAAQERARREKLIREAEARPA